MNLQKIKEWIAKAPVDEIVQKLHGVLEGKRSTDYTVGGFSAVKYEARNPSGDWRNFLVREEIQVYNFDTFACTTFANNNSAEIQIKFLTGAEFNFSDRAMAVLAENTPTGNYLYKPADVGRKFGRILEKDWPNLDGNPRTWQEWMKPIPQEVLNKRVRFKEEYEWIQPSRASIEYHLKQAPVLIVIQAGSYLHNVVCVYSDNRGFHYYDSYPPYLKITTQLPSSALKLIVRPMTNSKLVKNGSEWGFYMPCTNEQAMIDKALNLGIPLPTLNDGQNVDWPSLKPDIVIP